MKPTPMTADKLRELFHYDPETGIFTRLIKLGRGGLGSEAGTIANNGYRDIAISGRKCAAHRLAWLYMTGNWPSKQIDHINGLKADNRWENLREATQSQNMANSKMKRNSQIGLKGVSFHKKRRVYYSMIRLNGKKKYLGEYRTAMEAHLAYIEAAKAAHGEFARTEF